MAGFAPKTPMFSVKMTGNDKLSNAIKRLKMKANDSSRIMRLIAIRMKRFQADHFEKEVDSSGKKWMPLSEETLKKRKGGGGGAKILQDNRILFNSITHFSDKYFAGVGTNMEYAPPHQYGYKNIPQREFLYLTDKENQVLIRMLKDDLILSALGARY